jgi:putative addiction module CopG family antidote
MQVHIPGHLKAFIEREVASGRYASEEAVIADALERLSEHDTRMTVTEAVAESLAQVERGETIPWTDDFLKRSAERARENSRNGRIVRDDVPLLVSALLPNLSRI